MTRTTSIIIKKSLLALAVIALSPWLNACSMGQLVARGSMPLMHGGLEAMNRENDVELAKISMPANLKLIESLIVEDPGNRRLRVYAANGFYGYTFGFVEDDDPRRASTLYQRGFDHARLALSQTGFKSNIEKISLDQLKQDLNQVNKNAVSELFWTAACWAKWIDMNRQDPARLAEMGKAAALMQRVLELDETYYYGSAHLFFGIYYGNRPPMLGGNPELAERHFRKAREITDGKLLLVDLLYAQYLARQINNQRLFHEKLTHVVDAPEGLYPEMALVNKIAQRKARSLLSKEGELF